MSMMETMNVENEKIRLIDSRDPSIIRGTFSRMEELRPGSNYVKLWREKDSDGFYLYNNALGLYALTSKNTDALIHSYEFSRIEYYSEESNSFVAYRKDNGRGYLFFEDGKSGDLAKRGEGFIGEEHHCKRAVQNPNGEWVFFDCEKRQIVPHFQFKGHTNQLYKWLCGDHFVTKFENHLSISKYRADDGFKRIQGYFSEVEECPEDYIIGKQSSFDGSISYVLIYDGEIIGSFVNRPEYDIARQWFKAKKEEQWYFVKKDGFACTHRNWKEDNFKFLGDYILNKSKEEDGWQIYDAKTGRNVCQDWQNIRIEENGASSSLLVDTEDLVNQRVGLADIRKHMDELMNSYTNSSVSRSNVYDFLRMRKIEIVRPEQSLDSEEDKQDEQSDSGIELPKPQPRPVAETKAFYGFECENIIPPHIKFIVFGQDKMKGRRSFYCDLQNKKISEDDYICWVFMRDNAIVIAKQKYARSKKYTCVFRKEYDSTNFINLEGINSPRGFKQIDLRDVDENTIIDKINQWLDCVWKERCKNQRPSEIGESDTKASRTNPMEASASIVDDDILGCVEIESKDKTALTKSVVCGKVSLNGRDLTIGDKSPKASIFANKHYRILNGAMIILVDYTNLTAIDYVGHESRHYKIIGEGKDNRFSQDFNKNNSAIRDNVYPIFLFKPLDNDQCELIDQVICCDYSIVIQSRKVHGTKSERNVINFEFESLVHQNDWSIQ